MESRDRSGVTRLLAAWGEGNREAFDQLCPLIYEELRRLAHGQMRRERHRHTLQTTALVHEALLRLTGQREVAWESRGHFYAIAARMMRRVLVDYARRRLGKKRGGDLLRLSLEDAPEIISGPSDHVLAVNDALDALAVVDARKAQVVELRFFGGLSIDETARILGVSPGTVMRDWTLAKAWLQREMREPAPAVSQESA
ncbi:MAG: sigma-70 family RNA polymerase sigma factor [Acidobacteriota bacterium]